MSLVEVHHQPVEFPVRHLPVRHLHAGLRHHLADMLGDVMDGRNAVMQHEDLAVAIQLAQDGLAQHLVVRLQRQRAHRHAALRRGVDERHLAQAGEGHMQRARDGRGGHGEHSTFAFICLKRSFCFTPKRCSSSMMTSPRFLNLMSFDRMRCVPMTMSTAPPISRRRCAAVPCAARAGEQLDAHRVGRHALAEIAVVLRGQHGGGHQHRHLLAVHHRLEGGADGHLGLAVPHVAADQAVHGLRLLHVLLHLVDGAQLIGRLPPGKAFFHLALPGGVREKGMTDFMGAGGLHLA